MRLTHRHEVRDQENARCRLETGLKNQRVVTIPPFNFFTAALWSEEPSAVLFCADKRSETGWRGEIGPAQPVDRSIFSDESGGLAIANERIIFDLKSHARYPRSSGTPSKTLDANALLTACI
jgi:hypothetical protein